MEKRLAFIWDFTVEPLQLYGWADGLNEALHTLAQKYNIIVKVITGSTPQNIWGDIKAFRPTHILGWGSLDRPSFSGLREFKVPTALCFAGGSTKHPFRVNFDIIFVENKVYQEAYKEDKIDTVLAMGTNDKLFMPRKMNIKWDAIYSASFALWKRHDLFYQSVENGLAVGKIVPEEKIIFDNARHYPVTVMPEVPYSVMPYLYNQSEIAIIPARAGGQRSVLEAMACNLFPIVCKDNQTTTEFIEDSYWGYAVDPTVDAIKDAIHHYKTRKNKMDLTKGRKYILSKYTAEKYADKIYNAFLR